MAVLSERHGPILGGSRAGTTFTVRLGIKSGTPNKRLSSDAAVMPARKLLAVHESAAKRDS
jgi:hypothetical protein